MGLDKLPDRQLLELHCSLIASYGSAVSCAAPTIRLDASRV
jgi:hypothetical protein